MSTANNTANIVVNNCSENQNSQDRPVVQLPANGVSYTQAIRDLTRAYSLQNNMLDTLFARGNQVCCVERDRLTGNHYLDVLKPSRACTDFERVARLVKHNKAKDEGFEDAICTETAAKNILISREFQESLPHIKLITKSPVIVERRDGSCAVVNQYDSESEILPLGTPVEDVPQEEAKAMLMDMLSDFDFQTASDQSRAFAALVTPALIIGGILKSRAPVMMLEADKSQSGKGFFNRLLTSIYNETPVTVTQRGRGVGGTDEKFDAALAKGMPFISLDNFRGKLDSTQIESFLSESSYQARLPHQGYIDIDPCRYFILATSNNFELTEDFANRSSIIRIRKRGDSFRFKQYPEGNVFDHVKANQPKYLGAVFAIVKEWMRQGKPITNDTRHDFRDWCRPLDWIVQNILGQAPLLDGHREAQLSTTVQDTGWLKSLFAVVETAGELGNAKTAFQIAAICDECGMDLPGCLRRIVPDA
jgi:hypothetical protein